MCQRSTHKSVQYFTTWRKLAREMAQIIQGTEENMASLGRGKDQIAKRLAEKAGSSTFRPKTDHHKVISEARAKLKTCVVRSMPCIPMEGARGTYSFADFLPLKET